MLSPSLLTADSVPLLRPAELTRGPPSYLWQALSASPEAGRAQPRSPCTFRWLRRLHRAQRQEPLPQLLPICRPAELTRGAILRYGPASPRAAELSRGAHVLFVGSVGCSEAL